MPTYRYVCNSCGHELEEFQSIKADPLTKCPACGKDELARQIGAGAGILFKGDGFYQTDYRSDNYKSAAKSDSSGSGSSSDSGNSSSGSDAGASKPATSGGDSKPASDGPSE